MPKTTNTGKLFKQASRAKIITKNVPFTFEGIELQVTISKQDQAAVIYNASCKAINTTIGLDSAIEIVNDNGTKARLGFNHLKRNGQIHVRRVEERSQGPMSTGAAGLQTQELLDKIIQNWGLDKVEHIIPDEQFAPRENNLNGKPATLFDVVPLLHPRAWAGHFTAALYQLSKITKGSHEEALYGLVVEVQERNGKTENVQQGVKGVTTRDIKVVTEKLRTLRTADDALNVVYTENMVGGLQGALLESTLDGPTFSMVARGPTGGEDISE